MTPTAEGISGVLIHGRLDPAAPLETAWELDRAWPDIELIVADDSGHTGSDTMTEHKLSAFDRYSRS
ncbi:hypothetical protein ACFQL7_25000 [Halocatena marina]|uniref:Prolyl aminopeptidase n=1 Tax=Halocatena marina TaxID=2934937 RepID=A0ABD5YU29_9EURY